MNQAERKAAIEKAGASGAVEVTDHGNLTLYGADGAEEWGIV